MPGLLPSLGCFLDDFNSCAASIACCFKVKSLSTFMDTVTIYFNSFLWQRLPVTPKRPVITSSQPPSGRKSMSRKSNLRLPSWLSWQISSIQGSLIPSPKLRSRLTSYAILPYTGQRQSEVFPLPTGNVLLVRNPRPQVYTMLEESSGGPQLFSWPPRSQSPRPASQ